MYIRHTSLRTRRSAFTLIELLVVIAIIAILAAILFPVFAQAKLAAKKAADISNFKQVDLGTMMYNSDSDGTFPLLRQGKPGWGCNNGAGGVAIDCQQVINGAVSINPYVKNRSVWAAPNDSIMRNDCPGGSAVNNPGGTLSYTYNYYGLVRRDGLSQSPYALGIVGWEDDNASGPLASSTSSLNESQIDMSADTVLMYPYYATFSYYNGQQAYSIDGRRVVYPDSSIGGLTLWPQVITGYFWCTPNDQIAIGGYTNQTNWGWADGHVKSQQRGQLMDYGWVTNGAAAITNHLKNKMAFSADYH